MAKSPLDRSELQILRMLTVQQLQRIDPDTAQRRDGNHCPLSQAAGGLNIGVNLTSLARLGLKNTQYARYSLHRFIFEWDNGGFTRATLRKAVAAALSEREAAHAE